MLPQRGASSDRQETQHPVQANHLQVNAPAQEVRLPNPVITPRPLPPIPLLPPEVDGNSVDHSIHNPQLCAYSAPFPPTFRPSLTYSAADLNVYSDVTDLARRDLRGQKKQIQAQNTCEEAGKRLSERALVVTSHIHMPRPLPCPPKAAIAINRSFEEHLNDTASRHGGASYALSPKCPATPTPLSPLNPFDVRLRMDQQIPWCTTIADSRRNVLTSTTNPGSTERTSAPTDSVAFTHPREATTSSRTSSLNGCSMPGLFNNGQNTTINGGIFYHIQGNVSNTGESARESTPGSNLRAVSAQERQSLSPLPPALVETVELLIRTIIQQLDAPRSCDSTNSATSHGDHKYDRR